MFKGRKSMFYELPILFIYRDLNKLSIKHQLYPTQEKSAHSNKKKNEFLKVKPSPLLVFFKIK